MKLTFGIHADDYHSTITSYGVPSVDFAVQEVQNEQAHGYDVTNVELDGTPLFCVRCDNSCAPQVLAERGPGSRPGLCITHRHGAEYNEDYHRNPNRYAGD